MWKNQGSWNFFHTKLIPNSSKHIFPFPLLPTSSKIERSETDILLLTHQLKLNAERPIITYMNIIAIIFHTSLMP